MEQINGEMVWMDDWKSEQEFTKKNRDVTKVVLMLGSRPPVRESKTVLQELAL